MAEFTAVDNCGVVWSNLISRITNTITPCESEVIETYRFIDACSNYTDYAVRWFYFTDEVAPVFADSDEAYTIDLGCNPAEIPASDVTRLGVTDNCDVAYILLIGEEGDVGAIDNSGACQRQIVRSYMAVDRCGNVATQDVTITWSVDVIGPVYLMFPADAHLGCNATPPTPADDIAEMEVDDFCGVTLGPILLSQDMDTVGQGPGSITDCTIIDKRTYRTFDACSNYTDHVVTYTWINDPNPPDAWIPDSMTNINLGCNPNVLPGPDPSIVQMNLAGECGPVEVHWIGDDEVLGECSVSIQRLYQVSDRCNSITLTQTFTGVLDTSVPVVTLTNDVVDLGCASIDDVPAPFESIGIFSNDNCTNITATMISAATNRDSVCETVISRVYNFVDVCGREVYATEHITLQEDGRDTNAPVFVDVPDLPIDLGCNPDAIPLPDDTRLAVTDNCEVALVYVLPDDGDHIDDIEGPCVRALTRTYVAVDVCGNTSTASIIFNWTVDITPPTLIQIHRSRDLGCNPDPELYRADPAKVLGTDNCGGIDLRGFDVAIQNNFNFIGALTPRFGRQTAEIGAGIEVLGGSGGYIYEFDFTADSMTMNWNTDPFWDDWEPYVGINVDDSALSYTLEEAINLATASDEPFADEYHIRFNKPIGPFAVTANTNKTLIPNIRRPDDYTLILSFPGGTTVGDGFDAEIFFTVPTATPEAPSGVITSEVLATISDPDPNGCDFWIRHQYRITDGCGNFTDHFAEFTWREDTEVPTFDEFPEDQVLECNPLVVPLPNVHQIQASDNCDDPIVDVYRQQGSSGCVVTIWDTYVLEDACGNSTSRVHTITYTNDTINPVWTEWPQDVTLPGCNGTPPAPFDGVAAEDDCGSVEVTIQLKERSTNAACQITMVREYTATDSCGNSISQEHTIRWTEDNDPPVFVDLAPVVSLGCNPTPVPGPDDTAFEVVDGCGVYEVSLVSTARTSSGCDWQEVRTFRAEDNCGNSVTAMQTLVWTVDTKPPVIVSGAASGDLGCNPKDIPPADISLITATDNCTSNPMITIEADSTQQFGCAYIATRVYRAMDQCGNSVDVQQQLTWVEDEDPPIFETPFAETDLGCNPPSVPGPDPDSLVATDACGSVVIAFVAQSVVEDGLARTVTYTYSATDECNNQSSATQVYTYIVDTLPPVLTCPDSPITVQGLVDSGCSFIVPDVTGDVIANDNSGTVNLTQDPPAGTERTSAGTFTITVTGTDPCSNAVQCQVEITVLCNPGITLHKTAYRTGYGDCATAGEVATILEGEDVTFCFRIENSGDTILSNFEINDPDVPGIPDVSAVVLNPGEFSDYIPVTVSGITNDMTNTAVVIGTPFNNDGEPLGLEDVSDDDTAEVNVWKGEVKGFVYADTTAGVDPEFIPNVSIDEVELCLYIVDRGFDRLVEVEGGGSTLVTCVTTEFTMAYNYKFEDIQPDTQYRVVVNPLTVDCESPTPNPNCIEVAESVGPEAYVRDIYMTFADPECNEVHFPILERATAVELLALVSADGAVGWSVGSEVGVLGYNLRNAETGEKANAALIPARGAQDYAFETGPGTFILEEVTTDGNSNALGTIEVE